MAQKSGDHQWTPALSLTLQWPWFQVVCSCKLVFLHDKKKALGRNELKSLSSYITICRWYLLCEWARFEAIPKDMLNQNLRTGRASWATVIQKLSSHLTFWVRIFRGLAWKTCFSLFCCGVFFLCFSIVFVLDEYPNSPTWLLCHQGNWIVLPDRIKSRDPDGNLIFGGIKAEITYIPINKGTDK